MAMPASRSRDFPTPMAAIPELSVLPRSIQNVFADGREAALPLILGNTSDDASVILTMGIDPQKVFGRLRGAGLAMRILYPGIRDETLMARQASRDLVFTLPVRWIADRHSKLAPAWRYYFDYTAVKNRSKFPHGVPHGGEIAYVLNTADIFEDTKDIFTARDREVASHASDYWLSFARSGKPQAEGGPDWPNHRRGRDRTMIFGEKIAVQANFMRPRLNILIGVVGIINRLLSRA